MTLSGTPSGTPKTLVPAGVSANGVSVSPEAFPGGESNLACETLAERREDHRRDMRLSACLIPLGSADDIHCTTDNIGELGMHVTVPIGFGIAVGQRYELVIAGPGAKSIGMGPLLTGGGSYATVVRTELHVGEANASADAVGVGLRFDQPLVIS